MKEVSAFYSPDVNGRVAKRTYFKNKDVVVQLGP